MKKLIISLFLAFCLLTPFTQIYSASVPWVIGATEISRVVVNSQTRAWKYYDSTGTKVIRIDLFPDSALTDYANASSEGSFQWAIATLDATIGGHIHFNPGDYPFVTLTAINRGNLLVTGSGRLSRILVTPSGVLMGIPFYINPTGTPTLYDITFRDLFIIDPDPSTYSVGHNDQTHGIDFTNVIRGKVINCTFQDIGDEAIPINGGEDFLIEGNSFIGVPSVDSTGAGVNPNSSKGVKIIGNEWRGGLTGFGIHLETSGGAGTYDTVIQGNTFRNLGSMVSPIALSANAYMVYNTIINGNFIDATGTDNERAVTISGSYGFTGINISNNTILGSIHMPLGTLPAERVVIMGNYITHPTNILVYLVSSTSPIIVGNSFSATSGGAMVLTNCISPIVEHNYAP